MKNLINYIIINLTTALSVVAQTTCDVHINTGGSLQTHSGSQMGIFGNLNNNGSFTENEGKVGFYNQIQSQNITGTNAPEISDLIVDVPNDLNIEVNTIVKTGVIFNQGRVITPRIDPTVSLDLIETDLYINEGDDTHVDGYTSYTGDNEYSFPIGDDFRLRPLTIEASAAETTSRAAYFYEDPNTPSTFAGFDREELDDDVGGVSPLEFWDLDGDTSIRVTLTWDILSSVTNLIDSDDLSELFVVGWSIANDEWVNLGNTSFNGDENTGTLTSESFIPNDYEVITFGGLSETRDLPEDFFVFNAISENGDDKNAYLRIVGIEDFPNNNVQVFNRWGVKVFDKDGYTEPEPENGDFIDSEQVFTGISSGRTTISTDDKLPTGTYFYVLNYGLQGSKQKRKVGFLYLQQ